MKVKTKAIEKIIQIIEKEYMITIFNKKENTILVSDVKGIFNKNNNELELIIRNFPILKLKLIEIRMRDEVSEKFLDTIDLVIQKIIEKSE